MLGDYSPLDGTVEFYGRINAFLKPDFIVADFGAGRGGWYSDDRSSYRRSVRALRNKVSKVIGLDVDRSVLTNPSTDENLVVDGSTLPFPDASIDIVIADYVVEHLEEPAALEQEVFRVLKPGGLFCARTPHTLHYVSIGARLARMATLSTLLKAAQPSRKEIDTFETRYRCNTLRQFSRIWNPARWSGYSYLYTAEPSYSFGSPFVYKALSLLHNVLPRVLVGNIFVFQIKRGDVTPAG